MQESLGHKLRLMRAERGLSLREAARQAGMVKETISAIERGHTHPYDVTLAKLAKAYGVPVEELLEEPTSPKKAPSRPSYTAPDSGDEGRRALYLTTVLEEVRGMTNNALWMRDIEEYGESPQELTGWAWKIADFQSRVDVKEQLWGDRVLGPLSEQALPLWERHLLDQLKEEVNKADNATYEANERFRQHLDKLGDAQIKQAVEQFLESARTTPTTGGVPGGSARV
jgi:transcriptional regulator with XRE-family HTH domain